MFIDGEGTVFRVAVNPREQYSVWPAWRPMPDGWRDTGFFGRRKECFAHIDAVWTDMRQHGLRKFLAAL